ncbi:hypothetical protein [Chitinivorax sp. B]|uniref:hypothetical protein n=1 Tax=Chitinivorax sp. B TaxID=2502235 RepID=UPI0010F60C74|nr:hypothetical protein [Chitinivorax sp. B]
MTGYQLIYVAGKFKVPFYFLGRKVATSMFVHDAMLNTASGSGLPDGVVELQRILEAFPVGRNVLNTQERAMSLFDRYKTRMDFLKNDIEPVITYEDPAFPGNELGTCAAQVLWWCASLAGTAPKAGTGLSASLISPQKRIEGIQFGALEGGAAFKKIASKTVDLRGNHSAKAIETLTPWSGKYKCYGIASDRGHGHMLGAYFPWRGDTLFYDPNLLVGKIKSGGSIYRVLSEWSDIYLGCGEVGAQWGPETLFIMDDPGKALKVLTS